MNCRISSRRVFLALVFACELCAPWLRAANADPKTPAAVNEPTKSGSIEQQTKVHRLATTKRAVFDAFAYVNRLPVQPEEGETAEDHAGRIFGRLANQEGRVLLKLPAGMERTSYRGFKTFLRYEGTSHVGNCAACHTPTEFSDGKSHVVQKRGAGKPTPSLRNLGQRRIDLRQSLLNKLVASRRKRSGAAKEIDDAYASIHINNEDIADLAAFLRLLNDVPDKEFRNLILNASVLDMSEDEDSE